MRPSLEVIHDVIHFLKYTERSVAKLALVSEMKTFPLYREFQDRSKGEDHSVRNSKLLPFQAEFLSDGVRPFAELPSHVIEKSELLARPVDLGLSNI